MEHRGNGFGAGTSMHKYASDAVSIRCDVLSNVHRILLKDENCMAQKLINSYKPCSCHVLCIHSFYDPCLLVLLFGVGWKATMSNSFQTSVFLDATSALETCFGLSFTSQTRLPTRRLPLRYALVSHLMGQRP